MNFWQDLLALQESLEGSTLSGPQLVARYVLVHLRQRHDRQWLSGPRRGPPSPTREQEQSESREAFLVPRIQELSRRQQSKLSDVQTVEQLYRAFYLRGVVLDSHEGLVGWCNGRYPLELRTDVPTPLEMLDLQCEGRRVVTLHLQPEVQLVPHGRHADACAFTLHDLEHAHKFFGEPGSHRGQVRFFRLLRAQLEPFHKWTGDPLFRRDLDYLMADMNSHPMHLFKYLKAIVLTAEIRRTGSRHPDLDSFFAELFAAWRMPSGVLAAAQKINHPELESETDRLLVSDFLMQAQ